MEKPGGESAILAKIAPLRRPHGRHALTLKERTAAEETKIGEFLKKAVC